jgi:hypothetical protein
MLWVRVEQENEVNEMSAGWGSYIPGPGHFSPFRRLAAPTDAGVENKHSLVRSPDLQSEVPLFKLAVTAHGLRARDTRHRRGPMMMQGEVEQIGKERGQEQLWLA